ncbi:hypothetical protein [Deinococcus sonorensis]|uniref:Uncharacterized protein n=2 Tax=Deinococcus sonorensis TaxID=309891 RepID=A0AAU7UG35_9DEIO
MPTLLIIRRALMGLTVLGLLGLGAELAAVAHWYGPGQLIPFVAIGGTVLTTLLYLTHERRWTRTFLRVVAVLLTLTGLYGALEHSKVEPELRHAGRANESAAPLEAGARPLLGLPAATPNLLNGPAPLSAPLAMSGLGLLLFLSLYRREQDLDAAGRLDSHSA